MYKTRHTVSGVIVLLDQFTTYEYIVVVKLRLYEGEI